MHRHAPPPNACVPNAPGTAPYDHGPDRIVRNVYDLAGQRIQRREGVGTAVEAAEATWAYNLNGQVTAVIDGNGNRADLRYDGHMRQDRWTFPSATRAAAYNDATQASALASAGAVNPNDYESYGFDAAGNRTSLRKRDGSTLTYTYDSLNRMIAKIVPERAELAATHTRDVHYGYDLRNLQLYARFDSPTGEGITNGYDAFGRLTSSTLLMDGTARALGYAWDASGNRTRLVHPDGQAFATVYDGLNRPVWMGTEGVNGIASVVYLPHGAPLALNRLGASLAFDYDAVQRPVVRGFLFPAPASNVTWVHAWNPAGGIASDTRYGDDYAWTGAYNTMRPYTTNGLNQYVRTGQPNTPGSTAFTYDANGNLATEAIWNGSAYIVSATYIYDIENRLVAASGVRTAALRYDPLGRLYEVASPSGTTRLLYDGDALVAEYDTVGAMLRRHAHWPGADIPMTTYEGPGFAIVRQLFPDRQGSIAAIADHNGVRVAVNSYDEYGIPGAGNSGRFQYTGQIWLAELGMYHYKARIYSPTLGRFLQTDPVGYEGGVNLYAYVGNDPVNMTDPTGEVPVCDFTPGQCGMRPLTPEENRRRDEAYSSAGSLFLWIVPGTGAARGVAWGLRAWGASRAAAPIAVLGHYPAYVALAEQTGTRFFSIPARTWQTMTTAQRWAANRLFLDRQIARGAVFRLATPANQARAGSSYAQELAYLRSRGYTVSRDGLTMRPGAVSCIGTRLCPR